MTKGENDRLLRAGPMRATLRARDGGRVAALWRAESDGRRTNIVVPMPDGDYEPTQWPKAGIYPLVPWSGRIRDARFAFAGTQIAVEPQPGSPHALHGFAHRIAWRVADLGADRATMELTHDPAVAPSHGWPWAFRATQRLALDPAGLAIEIALTNDSDRPMPAGLGVHPFLVAGPADRVRFRADALWRSDADGCAVACERRAGDAALRDGTLAPAGETIQFAGCDGHAELRRADGVRVVIESTPDFPCLVLHAPPGTPYACIEPVSHVADAFNLHAAGVAGGGMRILGPGETLAGRVRIGLA
jgi:aldose 1-epimerase